MATIAPAPTVADQATNLLQKLSLESKNDGSNAAKKPSGLPYGSANTGDAQSAASQVDRSITPLLQEAMDPNFFYQPNAYASPAYYYPSGYDGSTNEWDSRYAGHEGMEMPPGIHTQMPSSGMGLTSPSYPSRMYPDNRLFGQYGQYGNTLKGGLGFGSNVYNSRNNGRWGVVDTKYKPRGRAPFGFGGENQDGFTELNRGPRSGGFKHQKQFGPTVTIAVKGQALPSVGKQNIALPDKRQFNQEGFPVAYKDAKFFVIKSYSEDDVHKSIKYNVWASTPNGNKKLDAGYREAQEKSNDCPVFLFFSVNTSGQFVGVAEMVGPVDFDKTVEYWQQDKWNGCFPLKWHIVKDVPNNILKHITLDNNDNKPVTNSRDTQEVKLEQGLEMLKIFKEHVSKTSILDDFVFYENRQKLMQEKRAKQQSLQGQGPDASQEKDKDASDGNPGTQKHALSKEGTLAEEAANASKPVAESGMSNGN
ncbi:unnamed protein product [Urochloa humidicola]